MSIRKYTPRLWGREFHDGRVVPAHQAVQRFVASPAEQFYSDIDKFFSTALRGFLLPSAPLNETKVSENKEAETIFLRPNIDISATDKEYILAVELPGVSPDNAVVEVKEKSLIISGEKKSEREEMDENGAVVRTERSFGSFRRALTLPGDADIAKISANSKDGVLKISIPRIEEKPEEVHRIPVVNG